jgi:hypothetical protein
MTMTNYKDYPFTANGVNFISRIDANSPFAGSLARLPQQVVSDMNSQAVTELIGDASLFTREELLEELARVNDGGTHAFILLDEGSN